MSAIRTDPEVLRRFIRDAFAGCGLSERDAGLVSDSLVDTSLRGVDSHGVMRVPLYVDSIRAGKVSPTASMRFVESAEATAVLDADGGMGHVAMGMAMDEAVARATRYGVASVAVRNSSHFGASGHYALMAVPHECIGLVWTNGPAVMPPPGGREARVSNNPLAIAVPRGDDWPLLLDISFSVVARGKVRKAIVDGAEKIPEEWMLTADGRPTTDPHEAVNGLGRPIADHKGFGLAFMGEILAGALAGSGFGLSIASQWGGVPPHAARAGSAGVGHICVAWSVASFMPPAAFRRLVDVLVDEVHACPTIPGAARPLVPGELEHEAELDRRRNGIPVSELELRNIVEAAGRVGVEAPPDLVLSTAVAGSARE